MAFNFSRGARGFGDINFEDDADTGIDFEADTVKIETGGAERLVVTNTDITSSVAFCTQDNLIVDGRIGIGTNNPSVKLEIGGNMAVGEYIYHRNDTDTYIRFQDNDVRIATAGGERLTVDPNGKVGIGTNAPEEKLHIEGNVKFSAGTTGSFPTIFFDKADGTDLATIGINDSQNILIENKTANKHIVFKVLDQATVKEGLRLDGAVPEVVVNQTSDSLVDFRVESDNNEHMLFVDGSEDKIGIGTSAPQSTLHIHADSIHGAAVTISQADNSNDASQLNLSKARGTGASPAAVQNEDFIGQIRFEAYDGNSYDNFGDIYVQAEPAVVGSITTDSHPSKMIFRTTAVGDSAPSTAITLDSNQNLIAEGNLEAKDTITIRDPNAPASSTSNGMRGEIRYDTNYIYIAVADNQWKRVQLSTW